MRLTQALDNLLDNAIRYSGSGGTIRVIADAHREAAAITIENPGPGFAPPILETAFEPFVSGGLLDTDGSVEDQPGAGLGLAIVKAVAQAHHGDVAAANVLGGARVTMTLLRNSVGPAGPAVAPATAAR